MPAVRDGGERASAARWWSQIWFFFLLRDQIWPPSAKFDRLGLDLAVGRPDPACGGQTWSAATDLATKQKKKWSNLWLYSLIWLRPAMSSHLVAEFGRSTARQDCSSLGVVARSGRLMTIFFF